MAATSPYSPNDYQALSNFRPYQLPINDIFKAITAQNEFWHIGAKRVKAVYENALSLDLTLDANKEVKKKYMEEAEKQLTKLSSMDLSDPSVQRQGFNIYKPLLQDEAIMYDNQLTKTLKGIYSEANSYRKRKLSSTGAEGEGYTDRNLAYSLDGFENFRADTPRDPAMLKDMYGKLGNRKFSPYYNPTQEYANILKQCKGSGGEKQDVAQNYMYFDSFSKDGANSSETSNCFMMGLSEKAKQQMGIDGWAYYKGNPQLLADDHRRFAIGGHEAQLEGVKGKIAGIKAGGVTTEEKVRLKELEDMLPTLQKEYDTRVKEYDNMVGGNALNYVTQNFQTLSKGIYLSKNYAALGEAFKSDDVSRKLTANAAGIAQFNAIERMYQQEREHNYNMDEIMLRGKLAIEAKKAGTVGLLGDQVNPLNPAVYSSTDTDQNYGETDFMKEKEVAHMAFANSNAALTAYMASKNPGAKITPEYIINFANEHSKKPIEQQDKQFIELMAAYNQSKDAFTTMDIRQKAITSTIENELGLRNKTFNVLGVNLTWDELSQIKNGREVKGVKYTPSQVTHNTGSPGASASYSPGFYSVMGANGRGKTSTKDPYNDELKEAQKRKDELYNKAYYDAKQFISPRFDPSAKGLETMDNQIRNILKTAGGSNQKDGYKLLGHDASGKDLLVVPLDEDGKEMKPSLVRARALGAGGKGAGVTIEQIGSVTALRIPNMLSALVDAPDIQQRTNINNLRDFQTLMESTLRNKGAYFSSENLKNSDGTVYPYTSFSFTTPGGGNIKVKAVSSNGQVKLVPSRQNADGSWDDNYQSFSTPEELVLYFRLDRPKQK